MLLLLLLLMMITCACLYGGEDEINNSAASSVRARQCSHNKHTVGDFQILDVLLHATQRLPDKMNVRLASSLTAQNLRLILLLLLFYQHSSGCFVSLQFLPSLPGILKDYLRELPEPLFTKCLYQMLVDALTVMLPDDPQGNAKLMFSILDCLPKVNRVSTAFTTTTRHTGGSSVLPTFITAKDT